MPGRESWQMRLLCLILLILCTPAAWADSWAPPADREFTSANGTYRLTLSSQAEAELFFGSQSRWRTTFREFPLDVLVADDGSCVVTVDTWGSTGRGDVVTVYDAEGKPALGLPLDKLFTEADLLEMPQSISSIHWRRSAWLDPASRSLVLLARNNRVLEVDLNGGAIAVIGRVAEPSGGSGFPLIVRQHAEESSGLLSRLYDAPGTEPPARLKLAGALLRQGDSRGRDVLLAAAERGSLEAVWYLPELLGEKAPQALAELVARSQPLRQAIGAQDAWAWLQRLRARPLREPASRAGRNS